MRNDDTQVSRARRVDTATRPGAILATLLIGLLATTAQAVTLGQSDDFNDGTTQGWRHGFSNPNEPVNVADAGPLGPGDDALQVVSTGVGGPASRFAVLNTAQWTGDFTSAGVTEIVLHVNNVGSTALALRVAFHGTGGRIASVDAVPIAAGSGWKWVRFPIEAGDMALIEVLPGDTGSITDTLAAVDEMRFVSAAAPEFKGDAIAATALFDNIATPEPDAALLGAVAIASLAMLRRRRR